MVCHDQRQRKDIPNVVQDSVRNICFVSVKFNVEYQEDDVHKCPREVGRRVDNVNGLNSTGLVFQHGAKVASSVDHKVARGDSQGDRKGDEY